MEAKERIGITKMGIVIVIAAIIIIAAVATAGWWFFLRPVEKKRTTIDFSLFSEVPNGEDQTIVGSIKPAVADATVTLSFTKPDESSFNQTVTSDSDGSFTHTFTVDAEGKWNVTASWPGNNEFKGATSIVRTFTVVEAPSPGTSLISCLVVPSELGRGESVTVSGKIWTSPAGEGAGITVTLSFTRPDNSTFTETVTSDSGGSFTYTYSSEATDLIGWWEVTASWAGTAEVTGDVSDVAKFHLLPVLDTDHPIKIGAIGPIEWIQGVGIREAVMLAAEHINEAGGILGRKVTVETGDEGSVAARGIAEMTRLVATEKVQFVFGGFRTEITGPMIEVIADYKVPLWICGSTIPLECDGVGHTQEELCLNHYYDRYKYVFRATPLNTTLLFSDYLVPYIKHVLIPEILVPALGLNPPLERLKVLAVIEDLAWTTAVRAAMDAVGPLFFGPTNSELLKVGGKYYYAVSPLTKDFSTILADAKDRGVHLIFEVFSGEEGLAFIKQWRDLNVPAIPVGINVLSQMSEMWDWTNGRCEYEAFLGTTGTRTPVTELSIPFWDAYFERWGHAPIYVSWGAYDALIGLAELINEVVAEDHPELLDPETWDAMYDDRSLYDDILINYIEESDRLGLIGRAAYTQYHDVLSGGWYAEEKGLENYVKPLVVQWQKPGRMVVVAESHRETTPTPDWVEDFQIPPWMLPP